MNQPRRWPIQPLMEIAGLQTCSQIMRALNINGTTARKVMDHGCSDRQADRWSCRLGYHPIEIWPNYCEERTPT